jgi:TonB family protein
LLFGFKSESYQPPAAALQQGNSNLEVSLVDAISQKTTSSKDSTGEVKSISKDSSSKKESLKNSEQQAPHQKNYSFASANKQLGALDTKPAYLYNPQPSYPETERIRGHEGVVLLRILVTKEGHVNHAMIERSSGYSALDLCALNTVETSWKFRPAISDHGPVEADILIPIRFSLKMR